MRFATVCSGLEAASLAWTPLGWRCVFTSEIEPAACAVLRQRFGDVPNRGDMTKFEDWPDDTIDLLAGGTPCQSYSVAGDRAGLYDPRGSLMLDFARIAARYRPRWLVWENVPGVLSSNEGRDFAALLGVLSGQSIEPPRSGSWSNTGIVSGDRNAYGLTWGVLDAQYFGLAQRRERVFVVGYLGDWRPPAAVLLESECMRGDPPPRRASGQRVASDLEAGVGIGGVPEIAKALKSSDGGVDREDGHTLISVAFKASHYTRGKDGAPGDVAPPCSADADRGDQDTLVLAFDSTQITNPDNRCQPKGGDPCHPLTAQGHPPAVAFALRGRDGDIVPEVEGDGSVVSALRSASGGSSRDYVAVSSGLEGGQLARALNGCETATGRLDVSVETWVYEDGGMAVRRLTPRECERLQGVPDDHTLVRNDRGKPMADTPRYKMVGNAWAVPPVRWLGERIDRVEAILRQGDG